MTIEQAKTDPRRNVLLQCVGASEIVNPDMFLEMCKVVRSFCFVRMVSDMRLHLMRFIRQSDHHL